MRNAVSIPVEPPSHLGRAPFKYGEGILVALKFGAFAQPARVAEVLFWRRLRVHVVESRDGNRCLRPAVAPESSARVPRGSLRVRECGAKGVVAARRFSLRGSAVLHRSYDVDISRDLKQPAASTWPVSFRRGRVT